MEMQMSGEYVELINQDGNSNKFYRFNVDNGNVSVTYGPIGKSGTKSFFCATSDEKKIRSQLKQKIRKGYEILEVNGNNVASNPEALNFRLAMDALTGAFLNNSAKKATPKTAKSALNIDDFIFVPGVTSPVW